VGYTDNGYRLWNPEKREIFVAQDVVFNENEKYKKRMKKLLIYGLIYLISIQM
jgi:hypothetical protein